MPRFGECVCSRPRGETEKPTRQGSNPKIEPLLSDGLCTRRCPEKSGSRVSTFSQIVSVAGSQNKAKSGVSARGGTMVVVFISLAPICIFNCQVSVPQGSFKGFASNHNLLNSCKSIVASLCPCTVKFEGCFVGLEIG